MSGEIKFRAWHKRKKMYISHGELFAMDCSNEFPFLALIKGFYKDDDMDIILEQYTGLKDKNGKEVYIGDLSKIKYDYNWKKEDYFEVVFSRKLGIILRNSEGRWFHLLDKIKHYGIVGNIHENKELFK